MMGKSRKQRDETMEINAMQKTSMRRLFLMIAVIILVILPLLFYNLYKIQIKDASDYQAKAIEQQTRDMLVSPVRGTIYDRNMVPLAISATVYTIVISPAEIGSDAEAEYIARNLSQILSMDYEKIHAKTKNKKSYYEIVARKVDKEISDAVREFKTEKRTKEFNLAGIKLFEDTKRYYPYSNLLSNVIGFTNYDNIGQYGIELKYEDIMKGVVGRIITAKNNKGSALSFYFEQYYQAQDGLSLILTVDYGAQEILEKNLDIALKENGCEEGVIGIVMDIKTGAILAMAQKTDYDLNSPGTIPDEILQEIKTHPVEEQDDLILEAMLGQWKNRAIQEPYEPGSVFKIITASTALEENSASLNSHYSCTGTWKIGSTTGHCWKSTGHGSQNFAKALQNSCNSAFVNMALSIGCKTFYNYFNAFGFTQKTNIDMLSEVTTIEGIHYHPYSVFSNPDLGGDVSLGTYGFGQTFKITPIQLITAVSAVSNGGYLMKPYVVSALSDSNGNIVEKFEPKVVRQVISEQTSKTMCELLESVVTIGTGKNAYVSGYHVGGKTGTSEKRDKAIQLGRDFYIASFLGIAPCYDPQIAVLVLLDEPTGYLHQGGQIAAPVVGRIMSEILPYLGVNAVYTEKELEDMSIEVPDVVGEDVAVAKSGITSKKFKVEIVGSGPKVTAQYPLPGSKIPSTSTIILYCGVEPNRNQVIVPNLSGKAYADALRLLSNHGLYMDASGALGFSTNNEFKVRTQNPGYGTAVTYGSVVSVEFYSEEDIGE